LFSRSFRSTSARTRVTESAAASSSGSVPALAASSADSFASGASSSRASRAACSAVAVPGRIGAATQMPGAISSGFCRPSSVGP